MLPARLFAKVRQRLSALAQPRTSALEAPFVRVRHTGSLLLIIAGAGMIAIALASDDGSAMQDDAAPPAAALVQLGGEAVSSERNQPPARVEAPTTQGLANPTGASLTVSVKRSYPFIWPADGPLTSEMGPWHTLGIDIGLDYDVDSPISASARGRVTWAGGEDWETYGHHVIIDHGGGMETLYGHLYEVFVKEGDVVSQGQLLGYGGDTGIADGKHLHFEVHKDGSLIDPQHVLPPYGEDRPEPLVADCGAEAIVVDSGAPLAIDFGEDLAPGTAISTVAVAGLKVSPQALPVVATIESETSVLFDSTPTVTGTGDDDEYQVTATVGAGETAADLACTIFVRTRTVAPSYYVRPTNTPTPPPPTQTPIPPTPTDTPTPTPTPTPTKTPFPAPKPKT
ncbi:MAG TPA: M23 family metallopeptidase [Dehalococcoidia bacterium]|nr:M23 family metallopeptidase [Dehalococcoidia bacterium]